MSSHRCVLSAQNKCEINALFFNYHIIASYFYMIGVSLTQSHLCHFLLLFADIGKNCYICVQK